MHILEMQAAYGRLRGVLKEEFLPGWAREKLEELQGQNAGMGGMEMT